jgi:hypothetical protein
VSACVTLLSLQAKGSVKCIPHFITRQQLGKKVPAAMTILKLSFSIGSCRIKVSDKFSPELYVYVSNQNTEKYDYLEKDGHKKKKGGVSLPLIFNHEKYNIKLTSNFLIEIIAVHIPFKFTYL